MTTCGNNKLKIYSYLGNELDTQWDKGDGCCGIAWNQGAITVAGDRFIYSPERKKYFHTILEIKSVCSIPVFKESKHEFIGVLNLDSKDNIQTSKLGSNDVRKLAELYANYVALLYL
jgi:putative methionine-R-sulfoxide reductase with GAF domain